MELTALEIAEAVDGVVAAGDPLARASSFAIDSRTLARGACFVAITADRDGHDFAGEAFTRGATIALVNRSIDAEVPPASLSTGRAIVRAADPIRALAQLGELARARLGGATVVGITGSSGKTGTKDLTAAALASKFQVHVSPGSFNNEMGVPLTLLDAPEDAEAIVLEMGARAVGNIQYLCAIARPTVGVITNVGLAHAGPLGGPSGVAQVKGELLEALEPSGLAVLVAGDPSTPALRERTRARVVLVSVSPSGIDEHADVRVRDIEVDSALRPTFVLESSWGSGTVHLSVRGRHQVANAALAAAVALAAGVSFDDVAAAVATVQPAPGRMEVVDAPNGVIVLNDTYNANPASTAAAVRALVSVGDVRHRVAVIGDMRELGAVSAAEHAAIGQLVADVRVDVLVTVGRETPPMAATARAGGVTVIETPDAAAARDVVPTVVGVGDAVLVKGSRAIGLEVVVDDLLADVPETVRTQGDPR